MGQKAYTLGIGVRRNNDAIRCTARLEDHAGIDDASVGDFRDVRAAVEGALSFLVEKYGGMADGARGREHARRCRGIADQIDKMRPGVVNRAAMACVAEPSCAFSVTFSSTNGLDEEAVASDDAPPMLLM